MKNFSFKLLLFVVPIIIVGILTEMCARYIPNDYKYKKEYLDLNVKKIKILFLGNSHVFFGVDPYYIPESFNAAHVSQSLKYDLSILNKYYNDWDSLKCVIIPIDYFSLFSQLEDGIENWRVKNYSIYYNINTENALNNTTEIFSTNYSNSIDRIFRFVTKSKNDLSINSLGWGTSYSSTKNTDLILTGKTAAKRHLAKSYYHVGENINYLNSIIAFSHKKKIKILFFTSPAFNSYTQELNLAQLNFTITNINALCKKNNNVKYINFLSDDRFNKEDFYDADHLNEIGAKKFSLKLNHLINNWNQIN